MDTKEDGILRWPQSTKSALTPRHHSSRNNPDRKAVRREMVEMMHRWRREQGWNRIEMEAMGMEVGRMEMEIGKGRGRGMRMEMMRMKMDLEKGRK